MTKPGHNSIDDGLKLFIERIENLEEEKDGVTTDIKEVYSEAKGQGYNTKIMRQIVRLRKMNPEDRQSMEALIEEYKTALGMDLV